MRRTSARYSPDRRFMRAKGVEFVFCMCTMRPTPGLHAAHVTATGLQVRRSVKRARPQTDTRSDNLDQR